MVHMIRGFFFATAMGMTSAPALAQPVQHDPDARMEKLMEKEIGANRKFILGERFSSHVIPDPENIDPDTRAMDSIWSEAKRDAFSSTDNSGFYQGLGLGGNR